MKRLLCLLLTGLMLFSAAACTENGQTAGTPAPADPVAENPAAEITPEPASPDPVSDPAVPITDPVSPVYSTDGAVPDVHGYADFADLLSASLLNGTQNRNLSPISVYLALAMLAEGAAGDTQAELLALLGCASLEELRGVCGAMLKTLSIDEEDSTLDLHDSLWMADEIAGEKVTFRENYLAVLSDGYRSEANTVHFGSLSAAQQIADWINEHTRGKIDVRADAFRFDPSTLAVLINTIYLKDGWSDAFHEENTEAGPFEGLDGTFDVDYMSRTDKNSVIRFGDGWVAYRVGLRNVGTVTFVLPDEGIALERLLGSPEAIGKLLRDGVEKTVNVRFKLPKFSFKDKMELETVLQSLGLRLSFTPAADFSGMSDAPCCVDSVLQESYVGVDENGIEAAAYTMISVKTTSYNPVELETVDFHLTRPFFYAIESYDGTLLFVGTVTNPTPHADASK
jgi:serpin B